MSNRSRRRARNNPSRQPAPTRPTADTRASEQHEPERLLLDHIAAGELDEHLHPIADAIHARPELLETINSAKALAMLNVGDRVRFNHHTRPPHQTPIPAPGSKAS